MITLDTNVIIYYLEGDQSVLPIVDEIFLNEGGAYVASVTELELFSLPGLETEEIAKIENFLKLPFVLPLDSRIARIAGTIRRLYRVKLADSIIAATALYTKTPLLTRNVKDFKKIGDLQFNEI